MAREGLGSIIGIAAVAGLGYWAYSSGLFGSLFGSSVAPAPAPPPTPTVPSGAGTNPQPPVTATPAGPCSGAGVLAAWLATVQKSRPTSNAAGAVAGAFGDGQPGTLTIDEWCYYGNQNCTGICDQFKLNADALFPADPNRGGQLNWSAFSGYARNAGLSGPPAWSGQSPTALPPGLLRTLPSQAMAIGRPTVVRGLIGTNLARRVA